MAPFFWIGGNILLIILILLRVPRTKSTSTTIDKNPKILDVSIQILTGCYLLSNSYLNIYN